MVKEVKLVTKFMWEENIKSEMHLYLYLETYPTVQWKNTTVAVNYIYHRQHWLAAWETH